MRLPADPETIKIVFDEFDTGSPGTVAALVAKQLDLSTSQVTRIAKWLADQGLLYDTGYAMKYERGYGWQYIERPKSEGGMRSKPGASTQWEAMTEADQHRDYLPEMRLEWNPAQHHVYALLHSPNPPSLAALLDQILAHAGAFGFWGEPGFDMQIYEEPSPLVYPRSPNVRRFALWSPDLVDVPFEPRDIYFAVTEKAHRYGKNGRLLKVPRIEIIPGSRPGTLGWVDWHWEGHGYIYIDFMKVRNDWRQRGAGRQLVETFYQRIVLPEGAVSVHWGRVMSEYAWKIMRHMERIYPDINTSGKMDF